MSASSCSLRSRREVRVDSGVDILLGPGHKLGPNHFEPMLAGSPAWLKSGVRGIRFGHMVHGGAVGPARPGVSWLTGMVENLVAPVSIGYCRTLRVVAADRFYPGCTAGLALLPVQRLAGTRFRPMFALPAVGSGWWRGDRAPTSVPGR